MVSNKKVFFVIISSYFMPVRIFFALSIDVFICINVTSINKTEKKQRQRMDKKRKKETKRDLLMLDIALRIYYPAIY